MDIRDKIKDLRELLHEHNYLYYIEDAPKISDFEFDQMLNTLIELERQYPDFLIPILQPRVGGGLTKSSKPKSIATRCILFRYVFQGGAIAMGKSSRKGIGVMKNLIYL